MRRSTTDVRIASALVAALGVVGCRSAAPQAAPMMTNPVFHFEIPVADLDRAIRFYEAVFEVQLRRATVDGHAMAFFPRVDGAPGASGALAVGDTYVPSTRGTLVYFDVADVDATVARALAHGGRLLYPKKDVGAAGFVAEVEDSEGNRIALNAVPTSPTAE